MQTLDYNELLEPRGYAERETSFVRRALPVSEVYRDRNGVQYFARDGEMRYQYEIVRLSDGAFLLATDCLLNDADGRTWQSVTEGDWIHIQFRLDGAGREAFSGTDVIETPAKSCVIARYPEHSVIERSGSSDARRRRFVCLFMRPKSVMGLLDAAAGDFPEDIHWIGIKQPLQLRVRTLPLQPAMTLLVNEILSCRFRYSARRAYMRAKSIELLSSVIHTLSATASADPASGAGLSSSDLAKITQAHSIIGQELEGDWTLGTLAARVGLNRAKLAYGFKSVYGISVRQFWRDVSLERATHLLRNGETTVTEIALAMGYSDTNSFTRAFQRKFGMLPSQWKKASQ